MFQVMRGIIGYIQTEEESCLRMQTDTRQNLFLVWQVR